MVDPTTIFVIVILAVVLIVLAWLSKSLSIDVSWTEASRIPTVKISFLKDTDPQSILSLIGLGSEDDDLGFITTNLFGVLKVIYGKDEPSILTKHLEILATRDIQSFTYHNPDSNAQIYVMNGFSKKSKDYTKIRDFPTWDGVSSKGPFSSMHKVSLPIPSLKKGATRRLSFQAKLFGGYQETLEGNDIISHAFSFRMDSLTKQADLIFEIPNGNISKIISFEVSHEVQQKAVYEQSFEMQVGSFVLSKYGHGWVRKKNDFTTVYWHIPQKMPAGSICKLIWQTERNPQ